MNQSYNVPNSWDEITIKQQLEVKRLSKENEDFKLLAIVAGYCGIPIEELKRMPIDEFKELLNSLILFHRFYQKT